MPTDLDVATWMAEHVMAEEELYQEEAVAEIEARFGDEFIYENENGNPAISRKVLREFRRITEDTVVWERGERFWRKRQPYDPDGKRQADG